VWHATVSLTILFYALLRYREFKFGFKRILLSAFRFAQNDLGWFRLGDDDCGYSGILLLVVKP